MARVRCDENSSAVSERTKAEKERRKGSRTICCRSCHTDLRSTNKQTNRQGRIVKALLPAVAAATGIALAALALAATIAAQDPVVGAFLGSGDVTGRCEVCELVWFRNLAAGDPKVHADSSRTRQRNTMLEVYSNSCE